MKKIMTATPLFLLLLTLVSCGPQSKRLSRGEDRITGYEGSTLIDSQVEFCGVLFQSSPGSASIIHNIESLHLESHNPTLQAFIDSFNASTSHEVCLYGESSPVNTALGPTLFINGLMAKEGLNFRYCGKIEGRGSARVLVHDEGEYILSADDPAVTHILNSIDTEYGCLYASQPAYQQYISVDGILLQ